MIVNRSSREVGQDDEGQGRELTMENELLYEWVGALEAGSPFGLLLGGDRGDESTSVDLRGPTVRAGSGVSGVGDRALERLLHA